LSKFELGPCLLALNLGRVTGKPSIIQRASVGRQFSGRATLEEAPCRELLFQNDLFLKHQ